MAGAMKASLTQAVYLFAAPLSQTARLVEALRQQREQEPGAAPAEAAPAGRRRRADDAASADAAADAATEEAPAAEAAEARPRCDRRGPAEGTDQG